MILISSESRLRTFILGFCVTSVFYLLAAWLFFKTPPLSALPGMIGGGILAGLFLASRGPRERQAK
jgi:hypothetical protein